MARKNLSENKRTARDLSFGLQQTVICWITDVVTDPVFSMLSQNNKFLMKLFGDQSEKKTSYMEQVKSEVTGDLAAFAVFVPLRRILRKPFDNVAEWIKNRYDGRLDKMGRKALKTWAAQHELSETDERYQHRLQEYKEGKAHDVVDSSLIGSLSLVFNTLSQKMMFKSEKPWGLVAASKAIGMVITVVSMLGFRTYMPKTSRKVDKTLDDRFFSKMIGWVNKKTGHADMAEQTSLDRPPEIAATPVTDAVISSFTEESRAPKRQTEASHANRVGTQEQREQTQRVAVQGI